MQTRRTVFALLKRKRLVFIGLHGEPYPSISREKMGSDCLSTGALLALGYRH